MDDGTEERWLPVVGYEENYRISDLGNVWSAPRATTRGGLLKPMPDNDGYMWVGLSLNGKQRRQQVHCLVAAAFIGPRPEGQHVRHLDGNPANNWIGNLTYGTPAENAQDMLRHGRSPNANKTHCPKGHEYTPENTHILKSGSRICRICARERGLRNYHIRRSQGMPSVPPAKSVEELQHRRALAAARGRRLRQRRREALPPLDKVECLSCGKIFMPSRPGVQYCSRPCRRRDTEYTARRAGHA